MSFRITTGSLTFMLLAVLVLAFLFARCLTSLLLDSALQDISGLLLQIGCRRLPAAWHASKLSISYMDDAHNIICRVCIRCLLLCVLQHDASLLRHSITFTHSFKIRHAVGCCWTIPPCGGSMRSRVLHLQDDTKQEEHGSSFCCLWQQHIRRGEVLLWTLGPILAAVAV